MPDRSGLKKYRDILFYIVTLGLFAGVIYFVLDIGKAQEHDVSQHPHGEDNISSAELLTSTWKNNLTHPLAILLLQIITIILVARIFGLFCKKIKQPTVVGEIFAGIFLGPSFVGTWFPGFSAFLFPGDSFVNLQFLSQIGLIFFMFVIGMELDIKVLKNKAKDAVIISHASIIFPFSLGIILAYFVYGRFAPQGVSFLSFSLFCGIATSITAFPVLARIVQEKGLSKSKLGSIAITCAAADDITAWCLLAVVIAIVKAGTVVSSFLTIAFAAIYVLTMLVLVKPFLTRIGNKHSNREGLSKSVVAVFFITLVLSSYLTEVIGIHALFGAFMAGVIMPANVRFRNLFIEKVEDISVVLLLPLFFVFTGLRTEIGLLNSLYLWKVCLFIILMAVAGKFAGGAIAARFVGQPWRESLIIGALMNTRGLMELVVLNIGYDLGVLSPEIFAMMVIMALVTTCMTSPAIELINRAFSKKLSRVDPVPENNQNSFNVLVSFGSAQKGVSLLRIANSLVRNSMPPSTITAMHLSPSNEINQYNFIEFEKESFRPIKAEAKKLKIPVVLFFKPSQDIESEVTDTANQGNFDLLLIGIGRSVFEGSHLGRFIGHASRVLNPSRILDAVTGREALFQRTMFDEKVKYIVRNVKIPVGILLDRESENIKNVYWPIRSVNDASLVGYCEKLLDNGASTVFVSLEENGDAENRIMECIKQLASNYQGKIKFRANEKPDKHFLSECDLVLISFQSWKNLIVSEQKWLRNSPSVLIIKQN